MFYAWKHLVRFDTLIRHDIVRQNGQKQTGSLYI
jgi:hypothetical protein